MVTPCINICKLDAHTNRCIGCHRTVDQLINWTTYTDEERSEIMRQLECGDFGQTLSAPKPEKLIVKPTQ